MNRIYINTNDGNYYRIAVRVNKPLNNIEIAWDSIRNAVAQGKNGLVFLRQMVLKLEKKL